MTTPSLREAIDRILADFRNSLHTCFPAQVLAYDAPAQKVDLRPAIKREVAADEPDVRWGYEPLPDLLAVPVQWSRSGGWGATFPIAVGDWMMVLCAEQSLRLWQTRGTTHTLPGINDPHGLNGCCAIPGWFPDGKQLKNVSATDMVVGKLDGSACVRIKPNGEVELGGKAGAQFVALAELVDARLLALQKAVDGHTHGVSGSSTSTPVASPGVSPVGPLASVAAKRVKAT